MINHDNQFAIVKSMVDSGPITFPRAIAFHPENGWTIIVYRDELMKQFSDTENQTIAQWLMEVTHRLHADYDIRCRWVRE